MGELFVSMIQFEEYKVKLNNLAPTLEELGEALDLDAAGRELEQLEAASGADRFWDDMQNAQQTLQKIKRLKNKIEAQVRRKQELDDLYTLCEMGIEEEDASLLPELEQGYRQLEEEMETARLQTLLTGEYDNCNAILTFHAGAGGVDAEDWTLMLYRMYIRWAENHGFVYKTLDYLDGDFAGLKSAVLRIEGENVYGYLKGESGVHRLVRQSPFDTASRRQTSFSALEVMPEITDDVEVEIRAEDLRVDTYRASGAGGQHVNKTESSIRITHLPTGIVVACQAERSQIQNREVAMRMLRSKLVELKQREHAEKISDLKGVQMKIEWGSQIRSYVFMPYSLAKDNRTGYETSNVNGVINGDLDGFINAYLTCEATGNWATK